MEVVQRSLAWLSVLMVAACTSLTTPTATSRPSSAEPETTLSSSARPEPTAIGSDVTGTYEIVLTRLDGGPTFPLPVTVVDHTGLVLGIAAFPPAEQQPVPGDDDVHGIVSDASPEQGFVYTWSANCAVGTMIDIRSAAPGGITLAAVTTPSTQGCLLAEIFRFLLIKTSEPIPLDAIELR
jgi:hypothetical protein